MKTRKLQTFRAAFIILLLTMLGLTKVFAFSVGKLRYDQNYKENSVSVVGYVDKENAKGNLVIPETVSYKGVTYPVTIIRAAAFLGCKGLTSVTIPNSVISIGGSAFFKCSGLTTVNIPNSVKLIGGSAFEYCTGLTSINIPNSVTYIGELAFSNCSSLTSIIIPDSITTIGFNVFTDTPWYNRQPNGILYLDNYCLGYKGNKPQGELKIKYGTRLIANGAFAKCEGLTSVAMPNSVIIIGAWAFSDCSGLTSITIPDSVTSIEEGAFKGCRNLKGKLTIPNSVTSIGNAAFQSTGWYNRQPNGILYLDNYCLGYKGNKPQGELKIKNGTKLIAAHAFGHCEKLISVFIPSSVTFIGKYAFEECYGLTSVIIESHNLGELDFDAIFCNCDILEENIIFR